MNEQKNLHQMSFSYTQLTLPTKIKAGRAPRSCLGVTWCSLPALPPSPWLPAAPYPAINLQQELTLSKPVKETLVRMRVIPGVGKESPQPQRNP